MVLTALVAIFYCLIPLLCVMGISGVLILTHALLRDPKHIENSQAFRRRAADSDDEEDDDSGEGVLVNRGDAV